jgi:hypothetical protein
VARKARKGFNYGFKEIDDQYSFFSLEIEISAKGE